MKDNQYNIDLVTQMAQCDANYIRLLKLVPKLEIERRDAQRRRTPGLQNQQSMDGKSLAKHEKGSGSTHNNNAPGCEDLQSEVSRKFSLIQNGSAREVTVTIKILERFRYTTTLEITQTPDDSNMVSAPVMLVRVYHDASTAEVISYQGHKNFKARYPTPNVNMYHRDEKRQVNEFLGEWLTLCLKTGQSLLSPELVFN